MVKGGEYMYVCLRVASAAQRCSLSFVTCQSGRSDSSSSDTIDYLGALKRILNGRRRKVDEISPFMMATVTLFEGKELKLKSFKTKSTPEERRNTGVCAQMVWTPVLLSDSVTPVHHSLLRVRDSRPMSQKYSN